MNKSKRVAQLKHRRKRKKLEAKREAEREAARQTRLDTRVRFSSRARLSSRNGFQIAALP